MDCCKVSLGKSLDYNDGVESGRATVRDVYATVQSFDSVLGSYRVWTDVGYADGGAGDDFDVGADAGVGDDGGVSREV